MLFSSTKRQKTICGQSYHLHTRVSLLTKCKSVEYVTDINKIYTTGERSCLFLLFLPLSFFSFYLSLNQGKGKSHHHLSWWSSTPCKKIRLTLAALQQQHSLCGQTWETQQFSHAAVMHCTHRTCVSAVRGVSNFWGTRSLTKLFDELEVRTCSLLMDTFQNCPKSKMMQKKSENK